MSRRAPNPAAERAAQNQATIKSLLKLEANKICSDCKRNKHPRWASWNLGVFICIRCSGIHRGMGTHISRVKSVDLDSWTDEQLQSVLRWGNARANKYWEAKLAPGHAPSEAKIENFIRTKYELKRWAMDGPIPADPATLDTDADDDVPLSLVREKHVIDKKETIRKASVGHTAASAIGDLIGGGNDNGGGGASTVSPPQRANSSGKPAVNKAMPAPPKTTTSTRDSLLGLDFLGGGDAAPARPSSTPAAQARSRPDLKQSILSLYASAPKPPPPQQQQQQQQNQGGFGGMGSPQMGQHTAQASTAGGFADAFGGLSMSDPTSPKPPAADPFAGLGGQGSSQKAKNSIGTGSNFGGLSGGSFFDSKPATTISHKTQASVGGGGGGGISSFGGDFSSPFASSSPPSAAKPAQTSSSSAMDDLFDFTAPVSQSSPPPMSPALVQPQQAVTSTDSVFNLSAAQKKPTATNPPAAAAGDSSFNPGAFAGVDAWGGNEWAAPAATPSAPSLSLAQPTTLTATASKPAMSSDFGGDWGGSAAGGGGVGGNAFANTPIVPGAGGGFKPTPKVTADEEFGGWASGTAGPSGGGGGGGVGEAKTSGGGGGFGGDDDLFSNVWQ